MFHLRQGLVFKTCLFVLLGLVGGQVQGETGTACQTVKECTQAASVSEQVLVDAIQAKLKSVGIKTDQEACGKTGAFDVSKNKHLVVTESWEEVWPGEKGEEKTIRVTGENWTAAIKAAVAEHRAVYIPERTQPYYIDAPIVLKSGQRLSAGCGAQIRLKPGSNTCMVRNQNIVDGRKGAVVLGANPDTDIIVEGGIWSTLATSRRQFNGNIVGRAGREERFSGTHGVILLQNVRGIVVRNVTIRQSRPFGIHIANASEFLVENINFEDHKRDGVHINGPTRYGIIRKIDGVTYDDRVALNGWEWMNCAESFGEISEVLVEDVTGPGNTDREKSMLPDGTATIRLLGGTKIFPDGSRLACEVKNCVIRRTRNVFIFRLYDQPNLEKGRDKDYADPIGHYENLFFSEINIPSPCPPVFQIAANADNVTIKNVKLGFDISSGAGSHFKLVRIGPMSGTYKHKRNDPKSWVEIYSPDKDCTVRGLNISNVQTLMKTGEWITLGKEAMDKLILVTSQKPNPDYPRTIPQGGTGQGRLILEDGTVIKGGVK